METPVGDSKCSWGPAYWCSTPEAAIECNVSDNYRQPHKHTCMRICMNTNHELQYGIKL